MYPCKISTSIVKTIGDSYSYVARMKRKDIRLLENALIDKNIADKLQVADTFKSLGRLRQFLEAFTDNNTQGIIALQSLPKSVNATEGFVIYLAIEGLKGDFS